MRALRFRFVVGVVVLSLCVLEGAGAAAYYWQRLFSCLREAHLS